jgi:hypothetical protein
VVSSSKRAEISERTPDSSTPERVERWYGFSIYLPNEWVNDRSAESLTQWHQVADTGGSPPLGIITNNGQWQISQHWENFERHTLLGSYRTGVWTDWVLHIKWSPESYGFLHVWQDGADVFSEMGRNKHADGRAVYMKFGIYKWDWQSNPAKSQTSQRVMFYDSLRIADETGSYNEVDPTTNAPQAMILRPESDITPWLVRGASNASDALNDVVTQPTPVTSADYIWAGGEGRVTEVSVGTSSFGQGSTAKAWFYANTGIDTRLKAEIVWKGQTLGSTTVEPGESFAWRSVTVQLVSAPATDDLRLRFTTIDGGDSNVRAAYMSVMR